MRLVASGSLSEIRVFVCADLDGREIHNNNLRNVIRTS